MNGNNQLESSLINNVIHALSENFSTSQLMINSTISQLGQLSTHSTGKSHVKWFWNNLIAFQNQVNWIDRP